MTKHTNTQLLELSPQEYRGMCRSGEWTDQTYGVCRGYAALDVIILPQEYAYDYILFGVRNPQSAPILDVTEVGSPHPQRLAPDADLRTDLPRYRVYKDGQVIDEPTDVKKYWRDDLVGILEGCSAIMEEVLKAANVQYQNNGVFSTNIPFIPAGPFRGNLLVSCRLFKTVHDAVRAIQISSRVHVGHGPPIHIGDPAAIGITDLSKPDMIPPWGGVTARQPIQGEVAMFWTGGPHRPAAVAAKLPLMILNYPVGLFMTDKLSEELAIL